MDILIPYIQSKHEELRYALRSFELYLPHSRVVIVGDYPEWLQNVVHIPYQHNNSLSKRAQNIYNKILAAFEITDQCIFVNDDHFMLQPVQNMPYHHKGLMIANNADSYGRTLQNTLNIYPGCYNFDSHCPVIYDRSKFPALNMPTHGIAIKSAYCAHNGITGEYYPDCKITTALNEVQIWSLINGRQYFSIGDGAFAGSVEKVLQGLYPDKSRYEK